MYQGEGIDEYQRKYAHDFVFSWIHQLDLSKLFRVGCFNDTREIVWVLQSQWYIPEGYLDKIDTYVTVCIILGI